MGYVKIPLSIMIANGLIVITSIIPLATVFTIPINKQNVYVGSITFFTGITAIFWITFSLIAICLSIFFQIKKSFLTKNIWMLFVSSQIFFCLSIVVSGTVENCGLNKCPSSFTGTIIFAVCLLIALVTALRISFKLPMSDDGR